MYGATKTHKFSTLERKTDHVLSPTVPSPWGAASENASGHNQSNGKVLPGFGGNLLTSHAVEGGWERERSEAATAVTCVSYCGVAFRLRYILLYSMYIYIYIYLHCLTLFDILYAL